MVRRRRRKSGLWEHSEQRSKALSTLPSNFHPKRRNVKGDMENPAKRLRTTLRPIPFIPSKILDFCSHENLLKGLGLWQFVNVEFNQKVDVDLIAQLVATYDPKLRRGIVNGLTIRVSRVDFARAFGLPLRIKKKKKKGVRNETLSDEVIGFIEDFLSIWMVLCDDTCLLPNTVLRCIRLVKDGKPEMVDWASLLWYMVEKELAQGDKLEDCYYAVHLQCVIKSQHREAFFSEKAELVELDVDMEEDRTVQEQEKTAFRGSNIDLKLGFDLEKTEEETVLDEEQQSPLAQNDKPVLSFYPRKQRRTISNDHEERGEGIKKLLDKDVGREYREEEGLEDKFHVMGNADILVEDGVANNFLQTMDVDEQECMALDDFEDEKKACKDLLVKEGSVLECRDEEGTEDRFHVLGNGDILVRDEGITCNYLQRMEVREQEGIVIDDLEEEKKVSSGLLDNEGVEEHNDSTPEVDGTENLLQKIEVPQIHGLDPNGKRDADGYNNHQSQGENESLNAGGGPSDESTTNIKALLDQMQQHLIVTRMKQQEQDQIVSQLDSRRHFLLSECSKRDSLIAHMQRIKYEEIQKRDNMIFRLQSELSMMGNIVSGYANALKDVNRDFAKCRKLAQIRRKHDEEYKAMCLVLEEKAKEAEEGYAVEFGMWEDKVMAMGIRLRSLSSEVDVLKELQTKWREAHPPDEVQVEVKMVSSMS
ncbi:unnamed protein product [Cuscuta europaea]|uniref:Uncharacterized protein n=1 Tax=Cuscuta europaea TaxID=41803 RepID=A0A9P1A033_CUSEU|nr:unnamed protein product [Cuscuta europaea]